MARVEPSKSMAFGLGQEEVGFEGSLAWLPEPCRILVKLWGGIGGKRLCRVPWLLGCVAVNLLAQGHTV
jgi:hypothetical protein